MAIVLASVGSGEPKEVSVEGEDVQIIDAKDSVFVLTGVPKSLLIQGGSKLGVVCDDLSNGASIVSSKGVQLQAKGALGEVKITSSETIKIFANEAHAAAASIMSSLTTESQLIVLKEDPEQEAEEIAFPEQVQTTYDGTAWSSSPAESI